MSENRALRRRLWDLADKWNERGRDEEKRGNPRARMLFDCAEDLHEALAYPAATEADEQALRATYGKTSDELADEAEKGSQ